MPERQRLGADHAPAVLAFELANRDYFAAFISDRGDEFFDKFAERHSALLAEQDSGIGAYYVLVDDDGSVLGRFNLAVAEHGLRILNASTYANIASQQVLTKSGFTLVGPADPSDVGGNSGWTYRRNL